MRLHARISGAGQWVILLDAKRHARATSSINLCVACKAHMPPDGQLNSFRLVVNVMFVKRNK